MNFVYLATTLALVLGGGADTTAEKSKLLGAAPPLANVVPPLGLPDHLVRDPRTAKPWDLPIVVPPFEEHVRAASYPNPEGREVTALQFDSGGALRAQAGGAVFRMSERGTWEPDSRGPELPFALSYHPDGETERKLRRWSFATSRGDSISFAVLALDGDTLWMAKPDGGLFFARPKERWQRIEQYGIDGPLSTVVTALARDSQGALWVGTPIGLSVKRHDGTWSSIRGKEGLPYEDVTALAIDAQDRLWIGTTRGVIHFRPYEGGRQWFYRQGKRYLPDDKVHAIAVSPDGRTVYAATPAGVGRIDVRTTTLLEKARTIERLVNERHRREGLVAECGLDDADNPKSHFIGDNDNDGLWTAYHVTAMSLCYGATKDEAAKASAREGMHALYLLQNASGVPGLLARSVVRPDEGVKKVQQWEAAAERAKQEGRQPPRLQWHPTKDGKYYWKSDTSSDEMDGHFMAFYAYWEHIARHDDAERNQLERQIRAQMDYLIKNNYQLIDWDGQRTRWGFWDPETLNGDPNDYLENGLNALQMLSFLRVSHHITGDKKYLQHYKKLILDHRYLSNVLLSKKVFPDENNHSDNQLGFVAWYPILQVETDPVIRQALLAGVRRHYRIVAPEKPSFYAFVYATIDVHNTDLEAAIENLREIPTDRRQWRQENSHRADLMFSSDLNRFGRPVLAEVVPADERAFQKWNGDPYEPDGGGDGRHEDDGAAYLLPYWMGRYHGFIAESE